jgi:hypothetical protein
MTSSIKRRSIVLSFVLFFTITTLHSYAQFSLQSVEMGVKGGGNFYKIGGRSFDNKMYPSFNGGAYAELNFAPKWTLQPELLYSETIANTGDQFNLIYPGAVSSKIYLNYISLPVLASFKPVPELSILLGPEYSYCISQTTGLYPSDPNKNAFSRSDFSIDFGGQLNLGNVKFGVRYKVGLNSVNGINSSDDWRVHGFQVYLGYHLWDVKVKKKK